MLQPTLGLAQPPCNGHRVYCELQSLFLRHRRARRLYWMNKSVSLYLDLVRFLAAVIVVIVHANHERFTGGLPILWRLSGLGNDAVMVFFVLSGFVIAYVSDQKERSLEDYMVSRLARLYSVVVPALLLTVLLDWLGARIDPTLYVYPWVESDPIHRT